MYKEDNYGLVRRDCISKRVYLAKNCWKFDLALVYTLDVACFSPYMFIEIWIDPFLFTKCQSKQLCVWEIKVNIQCHVSASCMTGGYSYFTYMG